MLDDLENARTTTLFTLETITAADFRAAAEAGPFRLRDAGSGRLVRLTEVVDRSGPRAAGAFSLLFVDADGPFLPQGIHAIEHARLGHLDLFLVPIGPVEGGNGYEAVFG